MGFEHTYTFVYQNTQLSNFLTVAPKTPRPSEYDVSECLTNRSKIRDDAFADSSKVNILLFAAEK